MTVSKTSARWVVSRRCRLSARSRVASTPSGMRGAVTVHMAAKCFCGCGRKIPKFPLGMRAINQRGQQVAERLAWFTDVTTGHEGAFADWIADGKWIIGDLQSAMHGETDPRSLDESVVRNWQTHGRSIEVSAIAVGAPPINEWLAERGRRPGADDDGI